MQKLLTSLAALALFVSAGQACDFHSMHVTASIAKTDQGVAMSTYDGPTPLPIVVEETVKVATPECPAGETDCVSANE